MSNLRKHKCVHTPPLNLPPIELIEVNKNVCIEAFLNFVVEDCRLFSTVEANGFKNMIQKCIDIGAKYGSNIDIGNVIPRAKTLSRKTKLMAEAKKREPALTIKRS